MIVCIDTVNRTVSVKDSFPEETKYVTHTFVSADIAADGVSIHCEQDTDARMHGDG